MLSPKSVSLLLVSIGQLKPMDILETYIIQALDQSRLGKFP
jgi:hypothetical protein